MSLTFALQALLNRHEAYMAEAEDERRKTGTSIDRLEREKKLLELENAKTIEENRYLLDQLEEINNTVSDSDAQILSLNNTLQSTRKEIERLTVLAAQSSHLEAQLARFEKDQDDLQSQLASKSEQERTALQRWKGAERTIGMLHAQVDRIEREAMNERARHAEVVARVERRRAVERELENAAGRLKGAAAATTLEKHSSNTVVSSFVQDILQDNANLQLGIVELREMLMGSNEEVENLREQMMLHQPVQIRPSGPELDESLSSELGRTPSNEVPPDLHVHHHYHAAPKVETKAKVSNIRKPKKRRNITSPGLATPSSGSQTPRIMPGFPYSQVATPSAAATILSQTAVTIPPPSIPAHSRQWSTQSSQPSTSTDASSLPNSPRSAFRRSSFFDTIDDALDSSRPTTPGSTTLGSPYFGPRRLKRSSDASVQGISSLMGTSDMDAINEDEDAKTFPPLEQSASREECIETPTASPSVEMPESQEYVDDHFTSMQPMRTRLHRSNSHESILSTRNFAIPKVHSKPSHLLLRQGYTSRSSFGASLASVDPVTTSTSAVVAPPRNARGYDSSNYNRLLLGNRATSTAATETDLAGRSKLSKRVGGWMFGKWGSMPTTSAGGLKAKDVLSAVDGRVREGRRMEDRLSAHVEPANLNDSLLKQSLGERLEGRSFGI